MRKFLYIAAIITVVYCCRGFFSTPTKEKNLETVTTAMPTAAMPAATAAETEEKSVSEVAKAEVQEVEVMSKNDVASPSLDLEDEILIAIGYLEHFRSQAYTCRGQWLVGYGQSRIDGKLVHAGMTISELEAQKEVRKHLRKYVFPMINSSVQRSLTRGEFIACCLVAYSTGTGAFKKSSFLRAINAGASPEECIKHLKGSGGVKKRRWVEGAIFMGKINAYDLVNCAAGGCYNFSSSDLYSNGVMDLSEDKVDEFLTSSLNQKGEKLVDII